MWSYDNIQYFLMKKKSIWNHLQMIRLATVILYRGSLQHLFFVLSDILQHKVNYCMDTAALPGLNSPMATAGLV